MADPQPSNVIKFDKGTYDRLVAFVQACGQDLAKFTTPNTGVFLGDLGPSLLPGATTWPPAGDVKKKATSWGESTHKTLKELEVEWRRFGKALKDGARVFEDTDDLATMKATELISRFPGLGGAETPLGGVPGGAGGGSNS